MSVVGCWQNASKRVKKVIVHTHTVFMGVTSFAGYY
jgi:hypothetical protein